jgi:serine/threonine protein kinase/tetratricopeptide (TPR) repeat protein
MDFVFQLLRNPIVEWAGGALIVLLAYQKLAPRLSIRVPGLSLTPDDIAGKILGSRYSDAKLQRERKAFQKQGNHLAAGRLYEEHDRLEEAAQIYLEGGERFAAASIYEKLGRLERAADLYLEHGDHKKAAQVYEKAGKAQRAAVVLQEKGNSLEAARLYGVAGQWDKAAELYDRSGFPAKAAPCYEKAGNPLRAAECFERHFMENVTYSTTYASTAITPEQKSALYAGRLFEQAGDPARAFAIYHRGGFFKQAATVAVAQERYAEAGELFMRGEDLVSAADAFANAGDAIQAATLRGEVALKADDVPKAARCFMEGKDYLRAAELFESVDMFEDAAGAYETGESWAAAGSVYVRAGRPDKAAVAYERAGDLETAAKLYEECGQGHRAMSLYDRTGQTFKGGEAAAQAGDYEQAVALLHRVPPNDESYLPASELLAQSFLELGRPQLAVERAVRVLGGQPVSPANIKLYYWLGVAREQLAEVQPALEIFKKILAEDLAYRDVEEHVRRLESGVVPKAPGAKNRVGKYKILATLGKGAMGEVLKAHDPDLNREVAVKLISSSLAGQVQHRERFRREAQSVAQLSHPNIVTVFDFGDNGDRVYMAMELLGGQDLRQLIGTPALASADRVLSIVEQICAGLAYAHAKSVIHRDLKPGNVRVLPNGQVKILDFGLARLGASEITQAGLVLGTPNYMSPEQVRGERVDGRSDLFSLGSVFYEMITGRKAFDADAVPAVLNLVLTRQPEPLSRVLTEAHPAVEQLVAKALAKDPAQRFQSAVAFKAATEAARQVIAANGGVTFTLRTGAPKQSPAPPVGSTRPSVRAPARPTLATPPSQPSGPRQAPAPVRQAPVQQAAAPQVPSMPMAARMTPVPRAAGAPTAGSSRFQRHEEVGRGPLGILFRGTDTAGGKTVALREIAEAALAEPGMLQKVVADLKAVAQVSHPNLAKVLGFVELEQRPHVITEFVPGRTYAEALASGRRLPLSQVLSLGKVVTQAVGAIHARGLVHGSLQPSNVMVASGVVKVVDLGLGQLAQSLRPAVSYRPPDGNLDVAGDLYALAAVLYHLVTGSHPDGQIAGGRVRGPGQLVPGIPPALDELLVQNLSANAGVRSSSAAQFLAVLSKVRLEG